MFFVQKVNYILLHKYFGCETTWHENSKFVQCDSLDMEKWKLIHMCATNQQVWIFLNLSNCHYIYLLFNDTNWNQVCFKIVSYSNEMWFFCILHIWIYIFFKTILFKKSITIFLVLERMFQLFQFFQ
jgi:hypothetical protein